MLRLRKTISLALLLSLTTTFGPVTHADEFFPHSIAPPTTLTNLRLDAANDTTSPLYHGDMVNLGGGFHGDAGRQYFTVSEHGTLDRVSLYIWRARVGTKRLVVKIQRVDSNGNLEAVASGVVDLDGVSTTQAGWINVTMSSEEYATGNSIFPGERYAMTVTGHGGSGGVYWLANRARYPNHHAEARFPSIGFDYFSDLGNDKDLLFRTWVTPYYTLFF